MRIAKPKQEKPGVIIKHFTFFHFQKVGFANTVIHRGIGGNGKEMAPAEKIVKTHLSKS